MDTSAILTRKLYSSDLCARDWQRLEPLLVEIVNAILYVLKNGCVWRDVPGDLLPWGTAYWYVDKWEVDGTWARVSACPTVSSREHAQKKPAPRP